MSENQLEALLRERAAGRRLDFVVRQEGAGWVAAFEHDDPLGGGGRVSRFTAEAVERRDALKGLLDNDDLNREFEALPRRS
jgi:hypothetical protein